MTQSLTDYDFYQSSNRMPIECSFGILIRRWGVLWRPLTQRFESRAPLIVALMHLHNFCIDERGSRRVVRPSSRRWMGGGVAMLQPGRTQQAPLFDHEGHPVHHLDT